jgi:hypothetical protein
MNRDNSEWIQSIQHGLKILFETYQKAATPDQLRAYVIALQNLSVSQLNVAVLRATRECKNLPVPATLIELSKPIRTVDMRKQDQAKLLSFIRATDGKSPLTGKLASTYAELRAKQKEREDPIE